MTDLNDRIRAALREDDNEALAGLADEPDLFGQVLESFRGRNRMVVLMGMAGGIVVMAAGAFCLVKFSRAESVHSMLAWSLGFLFCLGSILAMKIWFWMEMQKNAITREIKRLELQIARLAGDH